MGTFAQARLLATAIADSIPELNGRIIIEPSENVRCAAPFVYISLPTQEPVFAKNGIAGYISIVEIKLVDSDKNGAEQLKHRIIGTIKGLCTDEMKLHLDSISTTEIIDNGQQVKLIYHLS